MLKTAKKLGKIANGIRLRALSVVANSAARILNGQSIATRVVEVQRRDSSRESPLVFDLTVEKHHCYLANGLLVSNSDAWLNLAVGLKKAGSGLPGGAGGDDDGGMSGMGEDDERPIMSPYEMEPDI